MKPAPVPPSTVTPAAPGAPDALYSVREAFRIDSDMKAPG